LKSDRGSVMLSQTLEHLERQNNETIVVMGARSGVHNWKKIIRMKKGDPFVHISVTDSVSGGTSITYLLSTYSFRPDGKDYVDYKPLDFVFTPQLRPNSDEVIAEHPFRSPAFMVQKIG